MTDFKPRSFTVKADKIVNVLQSPISVHLAIPDSASELPHSMKVFNGNAIWDTGATGSVITTKVVAELGLTPITKAICRGVHGPERVNVYMVGMRLPNGVGIKSLRVTETQLLAGPFDVLIGMDIINIGDFAVSNLENKTSFTFRVPSCEKFDFVENSPLIKPILAVKQQMRNERCQCGSGKKFKDCCGKPA